MRARGSSGSLSRWNVAGRDSSDFGSVRMSGSGNGTHLVENGFENLVDGIEGRVLRQ